MVFLRRDHSPFVRICVCFWLLLDCQTARLPTAFLYMAGKLLYIGAGDDVRPVRALGSEISRFVYLDQLKYDKERAWRFCLKMMHLGFDQTYNAPCNNRIEFTRKGDGCTLVYFYNCEFPDYISDAALKEITPCDTLNISGFHPHGSVLDMMSSPVEVVCWEGTAYENCEYSDMPESVVLRLYKNAPEDTGLIKRLRYFKKQYTSQDFDNIKDF